MKYDYTLAIHFQFMQDSHLAREIFSSGKPFFASIVPNLLDRNMKTQAGGEIYGRMHPANNYYPEWAKQVFRENADNPNVLWVQEGYRHCCERCYDEKRDPYHEHVCLDGHSQTLGEQIEVIRKGKNLLANQLRINPFFYCPPNHLYNGDTLRAAKSEDFSGFIVRNGFDYFISGLVKVPAYEKDGIEIIPETKKGNSPIKMVYYDQICEGNVPNWRGLLENSSYTFYSSLEKESIKTRLNENLIVVAKKFRDFVK